MCIKCMQGIVTTFIQPISTVNLTYLIHRNTPNSGAKGK